MLTSPNPLPNSRRHERKIEPMTTLIENRPLADTSQPSDTATLGAGSPGLVAALRSELVKLTTVRSYRAIAGLTIVVGALAAFLVAHFVTDQVITVANVFGLSTVFTAVFAAISGILLHTSEAEHGTVGQAFAAQPQRSVVIGAKVLTVAGFAAVLALAGLAAGALGAMLGGVGAGDTPTVPATIAWATGFASLAGVLGLGIGLIARQSAAAISGLLVWWLVVESLVSAFAPDRLVRFLPFVAGNVMIGITGEGEATPFERPVTALIFAGYAAAALLLGMVVVQRTDP